MAIRILNVGAAEGILSVSFSKGIKGEPGKLSIKKLGSGDDISFDEEAPASIGGFSIGSGWKLISKMTGSEPGGDITTLEFIDGSYVLDTKNIVLFKRNISEPDGTYNVTKTVKIPVVDFNFSSQSGTGSFTIKVVDKAITVQRKKASSAAQSIGILGEEEWSSNPCDSSPVSYKCKDAMKLMGVSNFSEDGNCSFEGSYRSVLSSIAAKFGKMWYWDTAENKPKIFENTLNLPVISEDNCNIFSKMIGQTLEGSASISSWTYKRIKSASRTEKQTVEVYEYPVTGPVLHPDFPSTRDMLYETVPNLRDYDAFVSANFFNYRPLALAQGNIITTDYTMMFATLALFFSLTEEFCNQFGIEYTWVDPSTLAVGTGGIVTEKGLRESLYTAMGVSEYYTLGATSGLVRIVGGYTQKQYEKNKKSEIFYAAPVLNSHKFTGTSVSYKVVDVEVEPSPTRRGLDSLAETFEDESGLVRTGIWRSPGVDTLESDPGEGQNSEAWGEITAGCINGANGDVLRWILDGPEAFKNNTGPLKEALDNGFQIWALTPPQGVIRINSIFDSYGGSVSFKNRGDYTENADYKDPNELPPVITEEEQEAEDKAKEYDDPCEDLIQKVTGEDDDETIIIGDKDKKSGLLGYGAGSVASGSSWSKFASFKFALPSTTAAYRWKVKTTYQFSIVAEGSTDATNEWSKQGPINASSDVLSHSLVMTEIPSPEQVSEDVEVPPQSNSSGPVNVAEYSVNGFYLPIDDPTLQSLSASLDPQEGLVVNYRYQGLRPQPVNTLLTISPSSYQLNFNIS